MYERRPNDDRPQPPNPSWHGAITVDKVADIARLHDLAGIDASDWRICGLDIRFSYGQPSRVGIFAVERGRLADADHDWSRLAEMHEAVVPVTEFAVPASRGTDILALIPDLSIVAARAPALEQGEVELKVVEQVLTPSH